MKSILDCCCGLDVHKDKIEACILKTAEQTAIRSTFGSKSSELDQLCKWLNENECYHVAMESTGMCALPLIPREKMLKKRLLLKSSAECLPIQVPQSSLLGGGLPKPLLRNRNIMEVLYGNIVCRYL